MSAAQHTPGPLDLNATIVGPVVELRFSSHGEAMKQLHVLRERMSRHDELAEALRELIACQDMKDRLDAAHGQPVTPEIATLAADYECRKPWAWRFARATFAKTTGSQP